ncbi:sensor histidine kinase [Haloarcula amylovorans]|uniref:sensor histidine kinase n=1 Tax=Haloarcula amylovorans TaxID=2562280 RepID=UPI0010760768|nr:ATP-binding protein [Halomicroarcula amylolytica]
MGSDDDVASHLLYLDANTVRTEQGARELERRSDATVYTANSAEDALERLAWPDIDCLVIGHDPDRFDGIDAAERIGAAHPCLPVVLFSRAGDGSAARAVGTGIDEFVGHDGPDAFETLAATAVEVAMESRIDSDHETDDIDPAAAPNVDEKTVDRMLERDLDRAELIELLHKSRLFDSIFGSIPVHLYVKDDQARHQYVSSGYFEESVDDFLGNTDPEIGIVANRHARRAYVEDKYVIEEGEPVLDKVEYLPMLDQWNLTSKVPWHGSDGEVVGLIGVTRDISERKERQEQVRRQNERLNRFADMLSHDIRNPLQIAQSRLELARDTGEDTHLDAAESALERIDELIEDVLSLARQGQEVVAPSPVDGDDVVDVTWAAVDAPDATVERVTPLGTIMGDESRLRQLMANLFRNAIEHGGPAVTVRIGRLDQHEGFFVEDDGPGFPDIDDEELFEAGYTTAHHGTGFGLSIVKEIAEAHDWTVAATTGSDGGARVEFRGVERPTEDQ